MARARWFRSRRRQVELPEDHMEMVVTAASGRRSQESRAEIVFLAVHAGLFPALGAAAGVWAFTALLRNALPWPTAVLDTMAVMCGAIGLLAGGIGGFALADQREALGAVAWPRLAFRVGLSEAAVLGSLALAGVPPTGATLWLATLAALVVGAVVGNRGLKR
jgi:hypothetical protein